MSIHTNSKPGMPQPGLDAAREGRTFCKFINGDASLNAAATVIPDAGAYLDMELGKRYIVKCFYYALTTASDTVLFEIVTTSEPTGGGTVTAQTPKFVAGTTATVRLDREPEWMLAGQLGEVKVVILAPDGKVPIQQASLVQTKGLISETELEVPPSLRWVPMALPRMRLADTGICFPIEDVTRCVALP